MTTRAYWVISAALTCALAGCGGSAIELRTAPTSATGSAISLAADLSPARLLAKLPAAVVDMSYGSSCRCVWVLTAPSTSGNMQLDEVTGSGAVSAAVDLPPSFYNSVTDRVRTSASGVVWASGGYELVRYDPATAAVSSRTFSLEASASTPGATDPGNPEAGTWISAILPDGNGGAVVARANVASFTRVDDKLDVIAQLHDDSAANVSDLATSSGQASALLRDGTTSSLASLNRTAQTPADGSSPWLYAAYGSMGTADLIDGTGPAGGKMTLDGASGTLSWQTAGDAPIHQVLLPVVSKQIAGPDGQLTSVTMRPTVTSADVDPAGGLWFAASAASGNGIYFLANH
jgi:hypothetical protein